MIEILSAILICLAYILMILVCLVVGMFLFYAVAVLALELFSQFFERLKPEKTCFVCNRKLFSSQRK